MMSGGHPEIENTLRAGFAQCFKALASDVSEAVQLQRVLEELTRASRSILADLVDDWHLHHDLMRRLPNEIIADCFECLPFRDRVWATHVSRGWRSIALAHPAVWADIDLRERFNDKTALLEMALARSGQLPAAIRDCPEPVGPGTVGNILKAHISHIQYLELRRRVRPSQLTEPAPLLRFLHIQTSCGIREDFLGGRVGQLQTLKLNSVVFPPTCPALSTVTHLTLHPPFDPDHAATYRPLFRLFTALQSLSLLELEFSDRTIVPEGPAPHSLRRLVLETSQTQFDVCECYEHWASVAPNIAEVTITQYTAPTRHLRHLVSGAVEVIIGREDSYIQPLCNVVAVGPGDRRRTLSFWGKSNASDAVAQALLDARSSLTDVRTFDITSAFFVDLLAVLPALPDLAHLTATFEFDDSQLPSRAGGTALSLLSRVPQRLKSLTIRVERHDHPPMYATAALFKGLEALSQPATSPFRPIFGGTKGLENAKKGENALKMLLEAFSMPFVPPKSARKGLVAGCVSRDSVKLPDIFVRGISTVDVLCMQIPHFDGFKVIFDSEIPHPAPE